jgi:uncharacterized repeat protein (TIGR04042 family)
MPEVHFRVRWPDGQIDECYSPSTVICDHFAAGTRYPLTDFLARSRQGLNAANERVRARFGMGCSRAMGQLAAIETRAASFSQTPDASVFVETLTPQHD